jgi:endonuclease/exonuclease/phosphatase family metal-dependent hydrolase
MNSRDRVSEITAAIREQQPDLAALLDVEDMSLAAELGRELGMDARHGEGRHGWGIAVLSKLPIDSFQNHALEPLFHTLVETRVSWNGRRLSLFATHLRGIGPDGRTGLEARRRAQETVAMLEVVRPGRDQESLLIGDFNASRTGERGGPPPPRTEWWSRNYHRVPYARVPIRLILESGFVDCFQHLHPEDPGYTIRTDHPWSRIDFVFASPTLAPRLHACEVATTGAAATASHHFPLWAEFG